MNVFVLGGTGYLGSGAVRALLARGHTPHVLVRSEETAAAVRTMEAIPVLGDLVDPASFRTAVDTADSVIVAVAGRGDDWAAIDKRATDAITTVLAGSERTFVRVIGTLVYGNSGGSPTAETDELDPPPFLAEIAATERALLTRSDLRVSYVHAPFVYGRGGGDLPNVLIRAANRAGAGVYIGGGTNRWDTVHVDDVGDLVALAATHPDSRGPYVAAATPMTMRQITEAIAVAHDLDGTTSISATDADDVFGMFAGPLTLDQHFDTSRATALGWQPTAPSLADALDDYRQPTPPNPTGGSR